MTAKLRAIPPLWPAGHRSALTVVLVLPATDAAPPEQAVGASGITRLLSHFADLDVAPTLAVNPGTIGTLPELAATVARDALDLAYLGAEPPVSADREFGTSTGWLPTGTSEAIPDDTVVQAARRGYDWFLDPVLSGGPTVTAIPTEAATAEPRQIVRLPGASASSDALAFAGTGDDVFTNLRDDLDVLRDEAALMLLLVHAAVSGRPGRSRAISRFIDYAIDLGDVWISPAAHLARWCRERHSDAPMS